MPDLFQRLRRNLERDERVLIAAPPPAMRAAKPQPTPSGLPVTAAEHIASLQRQLAAANSLVAKLQEQQPADPAGERRCPHCAGMERTVRDGEKERAQLRRKLAGYELAATRGQHTPQDDPTSIARP